VSDSRSASNSLLFIPAQNPEILPDACVRIRIQEENVWLANFSTTQRCVRVHKTEEEAIAIKSCNNAKQLKRDELQ